MNSQTTKGRRPEVCPSNLHSSASQSQGNTGVNPHDLEGDNGLGFVFCLVGSVLFLVPKVRRRKTYISWTLSICKISHLTLRDSARTFSEGH